MARMKFLCDAERCIECNGCVTACKQRARDSVGREPPPRGDAERRRAGREVDLGRVHALLRTRRAWRCARSIASTRPPKASCCTTRICASAAAIASTPARSARRSFRRTARSACAARWTSARSARAVPEPDNSAAEFKKYGRNRLAEGKLPACAEMCSTKALLGGDADVIADIYRNRVLKRGKGSEIWGWGTAYGKPDAKPRHAARSEVMIVRACISACAAAVMFCGIAGCGDKPVSLQAGAISGQARQPAVGQRAVQGQPGRMGKGHQGAQPGPG